MTVTFQPFVLQFHTWGACNPIDWVVWTWQLIIPACCCSRMPEQQAYKLCSRLWARLDQHLWPKWHIIRSSRHQMSRLPTTTRLYNGAKNEDGPPSEDNTDITQSNMLRCSNKYGLWANEWAVSPLACRTLEFYIAINGADGWSCCWRRFNNHDQRAVFCYVGLCCYVSFHVELVQSNKLSGPSMGSTR